VEDPLEEKKKSKLLPVLVGAAAAAAIACFLMSDETAELRGRLAENINKKWGSLKDKVSPGKS
jgi:hypothetical protein